MATLTVTTTYDTAQVLTEAQLDAIKTPIETHFNTAQVEGSNIQTNILDGATYLADDSITTAKILDDAVTSAKLVDSTPSTDTGITAAKINTDAVTTAKLASSSVTTAKINDLAVTAAKILSGASVPKDIMLAVPTASATFTDLTITRPTTSPSVDSGTETLVGSMTFSGLTSGKPIVLSLQSSSSNSGYGYIGQFLQAYGLKYGADLVAVSNITECELILKKDGTSVYKARYALGEVWNAAIYSKTPLSAFNYIDTASSTSHTYSLYFKYCPVVLADYLPDPTTMYLYSGAYVTINSAKLVGIQIV